METSSQLRVFCTADVHSEVVDLMDLITGLRQSHGSSVDLFIDSGDFFEGNALYEMTKGQLEVRLLRQVYDYVTVGNHGYSHYLSLKDRVICCNVRDGKGDLVFVDYVTRQFAGQKVVLTGIIAPDAFATISARDRQDHLAEGVFDALMRVVSEVEADLYLILSHSGWAVDAKLAHQLEAHDLAGCLILISGHCHSANYGPSAYGQSVFQVKSAELGRGGVLIEWKKGFAPQFVRTSGRPNRDFDSDFSWVVSSIDSLDTTADVVGRVKTEYVGRLATDDYVWSRLLALLQADDPRASVLLNRATLRGSKPLGSTLTRGELIDIEPFRNVVCTTRLPGRLSTERLESKFGSVSLVPPLDGAPTNRLLTTAYLAQTALDANETCQVTPLRDVLERLLLI